MKTFFYPILLIFLIVFSNINRLSAQQINSKIQEVFANKAQELVFNDPERLALITDLLTNRVQVVESEISSQEKYVKLSEVKLVNKFNPNLERDAVFVPDKFNPLKYDFNILPPATMVYRVDNTNYLIVIQPQTFKKN